MNPGLVPPSSLILAWRPLVTDSDDASKRYFTRDERPTSRIVGEYRINRDAGMRKLMP